MFHLPIIEAVVSLITTVLAAGGLAALFGLMAVESFGIPPIPGEVILLFGGFLVAEGAYSGAAAFGVALAGGVVGSYCAFFLAEEIRAWVFPPGRPPRLPIRTEHLDAMDRFFAKHGEGTVLFARLGPVIRSYISYPAGAARMEPGKFGAFTAIGAAPFTAAFLYAGYELGSRWSEIVPYFNLLDDVALVVIVGAAIYVALRWIDWIGPGFPPRRRAPTG
jgi:membrane protein DedA with SNARE-associated domain